MAAISKQVYNKQQLSFSIPGIIIASRNCAIMQFNTSQLFCELQFKESSTMNATKFTSNFVWHYQLAVRKDSWSIKISLWQQSAISD